MDVLSKFCEYNDWANGLVFNAFEKYGDKIPYSSMHLLSHIVNAQSNWVRRIYREAPVVGVWEDHDLTTCKRMHREDSVAFKKILKDYEGQFHEKIAYTTTQGYFFETSIFDMIFHTFNHGTYHRAQIAKEMKQSGLEPAHTDYITFVR